MIELKIIKEQYDRMPDDELIRFAKNEAQHLTLESFYLLKSTFESRNLNISVINDIEAGQILSEVYKQSDFQKSTSTEYTEMIWKFAFDEKEQGKTNSDIFHSLLNKGIDEKHAFMLLESLESRSKQLVDNFDTEIIVGWVLLVAGGTTVYLVAIDTFSNVMALSGVLAIIGGIVRLLTSYSKKNKYQKIVDNIRDEKENQDTLYQ